MERGTAMVGADGRSLDPGDWALLTVVTEGNAVEFDGVDLWRQEWRSLDIGTLTVPHPSYPQQSHTLWPYAIERSGDALVFCAGELSNGVWCFHVPSRGQPKHLCMGMTVNERLCKLKLDQAFDQAIGERKDQRARDILIATGLGSRAATETVAKIMADPERYGFDGK
jgi:hypothetical protein